LSFVATHTFSKASACLTSALTWSLVAPVEFFVSVANLSTEYSKLLISFTQSLMYQDKVLNISHQIFCISENAT
jgi:hypothetical protein